MTLTWTKENSPRWDATSSGFSARAELAARGQLRRQVIAAS